MNRASWRKNCKNIEKHKTLGGYLFFYVQKIDATSFIQKQKIISPEYLFGAH